MLYENAPGERDSGSGENSAIECRPDGVNRGIEIGAPSGEALVIAVAYVIS